MGDAGRTAGGFQTTRWTLVLRARGSRENLALLLGQYWSPVYAYLRRRGHSRDDAADLTQAFLADVVLGRNLIDRAEPAKGRFRSFLLSALNRFVVDQHRRLHGRNGGRPRTLVPDGAAVIDSVCVCERDEPARAYDRQWATTVISMALATVERECHCEGMSRHWLAFEERELRPLRGAEPSSVRALATRLDARGPQEVSSMLHTVRRKLRNTLKRIVLDTLDDPGEVDAEIATLRRALMM